MVELYGGPETPSFPKRRMFPLKFTMMCASVNQTDLIFELLVVHMPLAYEAWA